MPEILRSKVAVLVELHQRRGQLKAVNAELSAARAQLAAEHEKALAERDAQLQTLFEHPTDLTGILKSSATKRARSSIGATRTSTATPPPSWAGRAMTFSDDELASWCRSARRPCSHNCAASSSCASLCDMNLNSRAATSS